MIARFITEQDPSVTFEPNYVGICHFCNDIFTRPDTRDILPANAAKARDRIATHRAFLEAARGDKEIAGLYVKS